MNRLISHRRPLNLIVLVDIIAFVLLYYYQKDSDWRIFAAGLLVITIICAGYLIIIKRGMGDEYLFLIVSMLVSIGFIMIYRLDRQLGFKQITWFVAGVVLFFGSYYIFIKVKLWDRLMYVYIGISLVLFLATLLLGRNIKGSTNWIIIGGYSLQPSELTKIVFIFFLACYYKHAEKLHFGRIGVYFQESSVLKRLFLATVCFANFGFLILQRDWGTSVIFFFIYLVTLYVFDGNVKFLIANSAAAFAGAVGGYLFLYHIRVRVDTWLNPWADAAGKGYQITQSLFAIGSGGFFGTGIGVGRPDLIPVVNTDFIFSAICEEMGIFGGAAIVLLYLLLCYRGFKIVMQVKDRFKKAVALGIIVMFAFQTFIIIGGVIKLIPLTGVTLPFVSYGGSSLTTSFIALGILQAISRISQAGEEGEADAGE